MRKNIAFEKLAIDIWPNGKPNPHPSKMVLRKAGHLFPLLISQSRISCKSFQMYLGLAKVRIGRSKNSL